MSLPNGSLSSGTMPRVEPYRVEPPRVEPYRVEPPRVEPPRVEPPIMLLYMSRIHNLFGQMSHAPNDNTPYIPGEPRNRASISRNDTSNITESNSYEKRFDEWVKRHVKLYDDSILADFRDTMLPIDEDFIGRIIANMFNRTRIPDKYSERFEKRVVLSDELEKEYLRVAMLVKFGDASSESVPCFTGYCNESSSTLPCGNECVEFYNTWISRLRYFKVSKVICETHGVHNYPKFKEHYSMVCAFADLELPGEHKDMYLQLRRYHQKWRLLMFWCIENNHVRVAEYLMYLRAKNARKFKEICLKLKTSKISARITRPFSKYITHLSRKTEHRRLFTIADNTSSIPIEDMLIHASSHSPAVFDILMQDPSTVWSYTHLFPHGKYHDRLHNTFVNAYDRIRAKYEYDPSFNGISWPSTNGSVSKVTRALYRFFSDCERNL